MSIGIKNRLNKLERMEEQKEEGGQIIIKGGNLSVEEWEAVTVDYMERARRISNEMKRAADSIYSKPGDKES